MGERDFSGHRMWTAAQHGAETSRMMWSAKRARRDCLCGFMDEGVQLGDFNAFRKTHGGQERRHTLREHRLAGAGWALQQNIVTAGNGNGERAFGL